MSASPARKSTDRSQVVRLAVLLLLLVAVLVYRFWPAGDALPTRDDSSPPAAQVAASGGAGAPANQVGALPVPPPVRLNTLESPPGLSRTDRNPFAFGTRPAPPPPAAIAASPSVAAPPPGRPQGPPPIGLRLMGVTVIPGEGRSLVTLKEPATNGVYQAFEGDVVDGRFRVVQIGLQSVVVSYLDGSGTRTIPLGG